MRQRLLVPLLGLLAACAATSAPVTPVATQAWSAPSPPKAGPRFLDTPETPPGFADPERTVRIVAAATKLDAHFAAYAERSHVPGLAVGLVVDGALVWAKGYGVRDLTARAPVDPDTVFRIASMTKAFTATAVLELRDAGRLSLDAPVEGVLPEMRGIVYPTRDAPRITLRDLLTHNAGLPPDEPLRAAEDSLVERSKPGPTEDATLKALAGLVLDAPPESKFSYSNFGFALAGATVSRVSGMPYAEFLARHVLSPLGMTSTSFDPSADRFALGYVVTGGKAEPKPRMYLGADPAAGLYSSVKDLAKWAAFQLHAWPPRDDEDDGPLKRSSVRESQRIAAWWLLSVPVRVIGNEPSVRAIGYGLGWVTEETCDWDAAVWHNGREKDGYNASLLMLPDRGVALVALQNLYEPHGELDASVREGMRLLDVAGVLPKREWAPSPGLLAARDTVVALREKWDAAIAARAFAEGAAGSLPELQIGLAEDQRHHGACRVTKTTAEGTRHIEWEMACDRGGQTFQVTVDSSTRIVDVHRDDSFPPEPRLAAAATPLANLVGGWDEKVAATLVDAAVDRAVMKSDFAVAGAVHGSCHVDHSDLRGDQTHGRFVLDCARGGPLELRATLDDKTGRLTKVTLSAVTAAGKRCL
ncbi:MAG: serine hydrolase domain-containing protein [Polyangiaceae bacterium]|jgi:CubicO group peptidase (beta-lactamase class C family)